MEEKLSIEEGEKGVGSLRVRNCFPIRNCFPKRVRLRKRADFQRTIRASQRHGRWLMFDLCKNQKEHLRLGLTVTKKYGKAHDRNRIKRMIREAFRNLQSTVHQGYDINVRPRMEAKLATFKEIAEELELFIKALTPARS